MGHPADSRRRTILNAIPLAGTLCAIAGAVDVIAYILFGKIFIANMNGNTVFFAASVILHNWREAALRLGVVIAFLSGILIAQAVLRKVTSGHDRQRALITLAIEFAVLSWLALTPHPDTLRVSLLIVLAFSLGMQNSTFRRIGPVKLSTAFISGDLENLGRPSSIPETPTSARSPASTRKRGQEPRFFLRHG